MEIKNCVFCNKDNIKSKVIETGGCFIFEPLNPVVKGHLLVVNKIHTEDFTDHSLVFMQTAGVASRYAKMLGGEYNLITSKGKNATQSVFHCHIHLVPRTENDGLKLPWS